MEVHPPYGIQEHLFDEGLYYFAFADAFGWTPEQVDEQPVLYIEAMLAALHVRAQLRTDQARVQRGPNPLHQRR